ncbi:MAG: phosphotransferase [Candidatus Eisenbacteria bacterium]|uniref:Phosphotransferase n=1 Tax=Eiseniibacteriota bacterium TaxID=2212470 RepID=A0A7Y2H348_UNCEI|nr:phosphotransferase [Candidatus Eisenbacteria bacterium]
MRTEALTKALQPWGKFDVIRPLEGGFRNQCWVVETASAQYVAKTTTRSSAAMKWLASLFNTVASAGLRLPHLVPTREQDFVSNGMTLEPYYEGRPPTPIELQSLRTPIGEIHELTRNFPQRPDFASAKTLRTEPRGGDVDLDRMPPRLVNRCREAWTALSHSPSAVVHGDLHPSNVLVGPDGQVALLDWDEARVDAEAFDLWSIKPQESLHPDQRRALLAWEIATCWTVEPEYARDLARSF